MRNKIYLASKSPRRKEILEKLGIEFEIVGSDYEEDNNLDVLPLDMARMHAEGKARGALKNVNEGIIIGSDTFVVLDDKVLVKPVDKEDARNMIKNLSGRTHEVITGVCFLDAKTKEAKIETCVTKVTFKELTNKAIDKYIEEADYMDKAGAYAIQDEASVFIEKIEGSYTNIVGLPEEIIKKYLTV